MPNYLSIAVRAALALTAAAGVATSANAATLIVNNGILQGATGVDVDGTLYDVAFREGTCAGLFNGCDEASDFTFTNEQSARLAADALRNQVLIDGPLGQFDADPSKTVGCPSTGAPCGIYVPYGVALNFFGAESLVLAQGVENRKPLPGPGGTSRDFDRLFSGNFPSDLTNDLSIRSFAVFSSASPVAAAVPEPGTWALMILGFGAVGGSMRRRSAKASRMRLTYA
ncbi:MAG: PEPxxWA-CTERM sorting domain-containing protein [Alphaproteobacteria bacterium]|nr:PEPxxWA-CTERM sorting domain-containing protein [Alphaproteobacteria bacterium]MBU0793632.1 PEPxxWA-CTERM sorting domain-containing protein [Alphaproteobacteria bacterium]MBU0877735.1 PEPxxWA-CTERM sorting domain-containing protein [Alphaproteobacteria bacterium]MBU1771153.1 PEPxxWA-CTERM sorting domain-containing protein [Alphaproteobacteria bacterium]